MLKRMSLFAAAAAIAFAVAAPSPAAFADSVSATSKKVTHKKRHHVAKRKAAPAPLYPALEPFRSSGFIGPVPGSCAYDRAAGNCMIDLGYGRCAPCNMGGGRP
jgi:hypothetical protein